MLTDRDWARLVQIYKTGPREFKADTTSNGEDVNYARSVVVLAVRQYKLSPVETEIAIRLALGETNALIAQSRRVSRNTVKAQVHHIYEVARVATHVGFCTDVYKRSLRICARLR